MRNQILFITIIVFFFSCHNQDQSKQTVDLDSDTVVENRKEVKPDIKKHDYLNISRTKTLFDSTISEIQNKKQAYELKSDTFIAKSKLYNTKINWHELDYTGLTKVVRHDFILRPTNQLMNIHVLDITYKDDKLADSIFQKLKFLSTDNPEIADSLDYSFRPGLTYTNDYLVKFDNKIYWLNTPCTYAKFNHHKYIKIFKQELGLNQYEDTIICYCGGQCEY